ncbi:hypothetical protein CEXT_676151 [Caerostris extrusa]|uniref:Uncharacterized protein n=1 Tax=Caerostris extrusa TaxID=172846 RepID=A0AAV4WNR5_CAEEX|nr:hypothetical protein CEXT_676151 [Caerostris extrusa]
MYLEVLRRKEAPLSDILKGARTGAVAYYSFPFTDNISRNSTATPTPFPFLSPARTGKALSQLIQTSRHSEEEGCECPPPIKIPLPGSLGRAKTGALTNGGPADRPLYKRPP